MRFEPQVAVIAFHLFFATEEGDVDESCCADAEPVVLDPLPASATPRERALRAYHEDAANLETNSYLSTRFIDEMKSRFAALKEDSPLEERFAVRFALCQWLQRTGDLEAAIAHGEECVRLIEGKREYAAWLPETLFRLAAAHFRVAERRNCIARHTAESCIFPLAGSAIHVEKQGADAARAILVRLLAIPDSDLAAEARWLLNIAHMALGDWPSGVPEEHRIAAETFRSEREIGRFVDRARELGLAHHSHAGSVILDDLTGDGRLDVFFLRVRHLALRAAARERRRGRLPPHCETSRARIPARGHPRGSGGHRRRWSARCLRRTRRRLLLRRHGAEFAPAAGHGGTVRGRVDGVGCRRRFTHASRGVRRHRSRR